MVPVNISLEIFTDENLKISVVEYDYSKNIIRLN